MKKFIVIFCLLGAYLVSQPTRVLAVDASAVSGRPTTSSALTTNLAQLYEQRLIFFQAVISVIFVICLLAGIFSLWMLVDVVKNQPRDKKLWIWLIVLFNFFGAMFYYFLVRRPRLLQDSRDNITRNM